MPTIKYNNNSPINIEIKKPSNFLNNDGQLAKFPWKDKLPQSNAFADLINAMEIDWGNAYWYGTEINIDDLLVDVDDYTQGFKNIKSSHDLLRILFWSINHIENINTELIEDLVDLSALEALVNENKNEIRVLFNEWARTEANINEALNNLNINTVSKIYDVNSDHTEIITNTAGRLYVDTNSEITNNTVQILTTNSNTHTVGLKDDLREYQTSTQVSYIFEPKYKFDAFDSNYTEPNNYSVFKNNNNLNLTIPRKTIIAEVNPKTTNSTVSKINFSISFKDNLGNDLDGFLFIRTEQIKYGNTWVENTWGTNNEKAISYSDITWWRHPNNNKILSHDIFDVNNYNDISIKNDYAYNTSASIETTYGITFQNPRHNNQKLIELNSYSSFDFNIIKNTGDYINTEIRLKYSFIPKDAVGYSNNDIYYVYEGSSEYTVDQMNIINNAVATIPIEFNKEETNYIYIGKNAPGTTITESTELNKWVKLHDTNFTRTLEKAIITIENNACWLYNGHNSGYTKININNIINNTSVTYIALPTNITNNLYWNSGASAWYNLNKIGSNIKINNRPFNVYERIGGAYISV